MKKRRYKRPADLSKFHEPVENLKIWIDGPIEDGPAKIVAGAPDGNPVELSIIEAGLLADLLRRLTEPGFPRIPNPRAPGYDSLMHQVCFEWGFCGCFKLGRPMHVDYILPARGPVTADQFAEWVILADNDNPNRENGLRWKTMIREAFVKHMGAEVVDVKKLRWSNMDI